MSNISTWLSWSRKEVSYRAFWKRPVCRLIWCKKNFKRPWIASHASPASELGEIEEHVRGKVMGELRIHFRPEFLNRVDEIVLFKPLTLSEIKRIIDLQLKMLRVRLSERHLDLELTEAAKEYIARQGYDPASAISLNNFSVAADALVVLETSAARKPRRPGEPRLCAAAGISKAISWLRLKRC
jgi:ClpA/ClpB-like protein